MSKQLRKHQTARGSRRPRASSPDAQPSNLRRFTIRSWAITEQLFRRRRDRAAILDLMGFFDWLGDSNLEIIKRSLPPLPCKTGCDYCCYVSAEHPDVLPVEVFRITSYLTGMGSAVQGVVRDRLRAAAAGAVEEASSRSPCLFLTQNRCLVYPVRPLRCRAQHSPDAEACRQSYLGHRDTIPLLSQPALLYESLQTGIRLGLRNLGLQNSRLKLTGAIAVALQEPESLTRWLTGASVFLEVESPIAGDEERLVTQFARQAKHQARNEGRQLQSVISTLLERPGEWASYTTSGIVPLGTDRSGKE